MELQIGGNGVSVARDCHSGGGVVVAIAGRFDVLDLAHICALRWARGLGDCLIVCMHDGGEWVHADGASTTASARRVLALDFVDGVTTFSPSTACETLMLVRPDVFVRGLDYEGSPFAEAWTVQGWGGRVELCPRVRGCHPNGDISTFSYELVSVSMARGTN